MIKTNLTYEQFKEKTCKQNECQAELLQVYENVFKPLLKKWDGKVYNKRFRTAIEQEIEAQGYGKTYKIYLREENQYHDEVTLVLQQYRTPGNWSESEQLYIMLIVKYADGYYHISEADTLSSDRGQAWLNNARENIEERNEAVKNWKKYMKLADKLQQAIEAYNEIPYSFRQNIAKYQFNIH